MQRGKLNLKRFLHRSGGKIKAARRRVFVRVLVGSLVALMAATATGLLLMTESTVAAPLENEYLFNIPYTYIPPRTPADLNWTKNADHVGYDRAYTQPISQDYNGTATDHHVVINDQSITFFGYDVDPYIDYCFTDAYPTLTSINITMRPMQMIFHTFYQTGFLFNGIMEETVVAGAKKTTYTGYAVVLECSNSEGMLESGDATLKLVYIDHEEWDVDGANSSRKVEQEKSPLKTRTLLATLKSGIQNRTTPVFRITLDIDPSTRAFRLYIDGELRARVTAEDVKSGPGSVGLGFFTEYYYHNCDILTVVRYDDLNLEFAPMDPPRSTATLRFMPDTGSVALRDPETTEGYTDLQYYRAEQPPELQINGETYYLVDSNMVSLGYPLDRDIVRQYATTVSNPNANTIILYYSKDPPNIIGNKPRKFGSVNGGEWKTGSPELPVPVDGNYNLEYNVVSGPKPMTPDESDHLPVLAQGNAGTTANTTWMKQPQTGTLITKNNVVTINTVSLEQNYPTLTDFENEVTEWRGEEIIKAWGATYSPNDPPMNNLLRTAQWTQAIPFNTYDYTTIIPYLDSLNVTNMNIVGGVSTHPYTSSADYLAIYRLTMQDNTVPDEICWYGRNESNSNHNSVLLYTGGTWVEIGQVLSTAYANYTWTLTPSQKAGLSGNNIHIAFFSVKNGTYSGLYNGSTEPFSLTYPASSGPTQPEPIERCYIWLTKNINWTSATPRYNMYIGGAGGVQLAENAALQFANFGALTAINFSKLHTDNTLGMAYMFMNCTGLTKLDVSWFYTLNAQNMSGMFYGCSYLTSVDVKYFDTRNVTNMGAMFYGCSRVTSLALRGWDTAKVTEMGQMFYNCSSLPGLDLRAFDTGLVENMNSMFYGCSGLKTLDISTFNTVNVTNMGYMFYSCSTLPSLTVTNFNTAKVTQMAFMFAYCQALTTLDCSSFKTLAPGLNSMESMFQQCYRMTSVNVSSFETQNIEIFTNMFSGCSYLTALNVTNFNTSSAVNMYAMFQSCSALYALDVTNFNTASVINMNYLFQGCTNLRSASPYNFNVLNFNTSSCKTMFGMFQGCQYLTNLDLRSFNTSNVQGIATSPTASIADNFGGMAQMFYQCYRLENLNVSSFDTSSVGTMANMFGYVYYSSYSPGTMVLDLRNFDTSSVKNMSGMFANNNHAGFGPGKLLISTWDTSGVTDMSSMFLGCAGFTGNGFDALLAHFDTSSLINMTSMFQSCSGITSISLPGFDTSSVTGMSALFASCTALVSVDLRSFDTSRVNSFASMFSGCTALTTAGVYNNGIKYFNTAASGSFASMFQGCAALTGTLDLRNFSTGSASNFSYMFQGCTNLTGINLASFNTANATTFQSMFQNCAALTVLDLRSFNTERVYYFNSMFQGCTLLNTIHLSSFNTKAASTFASMFQDCPALTTLNLSTFVTGTATNFSYMFSGCTGLTTLSLGNFDTKNATTFAYMFNNCSSLATLNGISHFNTEKVSDMRYMFYGCKELTSLDIRWWETPALRWLNDMFNMGEGSKLATVHLESMDILIDPVNPPLYSSGVWAITRMFANVKPTGMTIYVGSIDMMTWFDNAEEKISQADMDLITRIRVNPWPGTNENPGPDEPTTAVVLPVDYQAPPGNLTPNPATPATPPPVVPPQAPAITPITPPAPPAVQPSQPNPPKTVTDAIPAGLVINPLGVTGGGVISGQTITWEVDSFTFDFYVMTKVTPRVDEDGFMYENFATVHIGPDEDTTHTYHVYGLYWLVTEQYYYFDDGGAHTRIASNNEFNGGLPVVVRNGKNFILSQAHIPEELYGLYYYGYQYIIDPADDPAATGKGDIHLGPPPATIYTNVQQDKRIRYYYRSFPIAVYIHFVDASGNEIRETVVWAANKGNNYYLPVSYLDPILVPPLYNYYGYKLTAPADGPHKTRGIQPDYTILTNDGSPQFANIQEDKHITLYFDVAPAVTVYFLDDYKPSNVIKGSQTYFVTSGSTFTPASGLYADIISAGNTYEYADNWSFNTGARQTSPSKPAPFTVTGNVDLNLFFKTHYNILEKFHKDTEPRYDHLHNRLPPDELSPDVFRERLPAGTPYTGEPPTVLVDDVGDVWSYIGYKLNDDSNLLYLGIPSVAGLEEHLCIIFVYEKTPAAPAIQKQSSVPTETSLIPGEEFTYTISVEYPSAKSGTMVFEDLLPAGLEFVSSTPSASTANVGGRTKVTASVPLASNKAQLVITVRVVAEEAVFRNYADVTDPSSKVYRTNTVINHSGGSLDSISVQKSASPASGTEDFPKIIAKNSEITYTITVTNDNEAGKRIPAVITDILPPGLVCTGTEDGGSYNDLNRTVTWNVTSLPSGDSTYSFTVRAEDAVVYENTASMKLPGLAAIKTNSTWHAVAAPIPDELSIPVKKAFLNGGEEFDNGSAEDPAMVLIGETIKYTIEFEKPSLLTVANPTFQPQATLPAKINFSYIELTKSNSAPTVSGVKTADAGSKVTYTVKVQNTGESDASNVILRDILPAGTSLVAGSVKIDGTATSNYAYNAETRLVKVYVGAGATSSQGGLVAGHESYSTDCNNVYNVTFEVYVDGRVIAQNRKYENQAKVSYTDRYDTEAYEYTNYSNVDEFALGKGLRDVITDKVPAGLTVDVPSVTASGGTYSAGTHTVTWDIYSKTPGPVSLSFEVTVTDIPEDSIYINRALVGTEYTNRTYHEMVIPTPEKNAYINDSETAENGEEGSPAEVKMGDKITYEIDVFNPGTAGGQGIAYDFVFVLDWSGSMNGTMQSGKTGGSIGARLYSKDIILDMSQELFGLYPDSRIAVMGLNCKVNISDAPQYTFLQVDTPFVGVADYASTIEHAYDYHPAFYQDDDSQFLAAAVDKMAGINTVPYGASVGVSDTGNPQDPARLPQNGPYYVDARAPGDMDRIPVIVLISDFQMAAGHTAGGRNYWTQCLKDQSDRFYQLCPEGVLMTVRTDHASNGTYNTAPYDTLMETNVAPAGHDLWSFTKVPSSTPYLDAFNTLKDKILESAPPMALGGIVTDVVPAGLVVDEGSIDPPGTFDPETNTITWDLSEMDIGWVKLSFDTTVKTPGLYENTAHVVYSDGTEDDSNTTYHILALLKLHIRQIVIDPISALPRPVMGYYTLLNDGMTLLLTSDSVTPGYPFTEYTLIPGEELLYTLTDIVPQYYEFVGHMQNDGDKQLPDPGGHPTASPLADPPVDLATANGSIELDYSNTGEIWITVYITPKGKPGNQQTGVETNRFGTVYPPAP